MTVTLELNEQMEAELRTWAKRNKQGLQSESDVRAALENLIAAALYEDARDWEESLEAIERALQDEREGRFTPLAEWDKKFRERHGIAASASDDAGAVVADKMAA